MFFSDNTLYSTFALMIKILKWAPIIIITYEHKWYMWDFRFKVQDYVDTQHLVAKQENYKLNIIQQIEREFI